ncbi:recombinase family protein [Rheinheimera baltica]|uniref:recombinase zinc beta ribbon domain-containing protein n=1 Tax=Rheinheimera baltica TaxID=67576 RepID=UPI00040D4F9F|nr:recombinase family protein [Rheinheimera baltica]
MKRKAYFYQRVSSDAQRNNSSLFRQSETQKAWLAMNPGVELETILVDDGYSAFNGDNVQYGELGVFLDQIEKGLIEKGSILVLEQFSRLTRLPIGKTRKLLSKIWLGGVTIVTITDNQEYPPESENDFGKSVRLLVEIESAHKDSEWRSKKVKASWTRRESLAKEKKVAPRMRMPFWLDRHGKLNDFAPVVADLFSLHARGLGQVLIERELRQKYGDIKPLKNINPTKIIRILKSEKCIGKVYGEKLFDAVVDEETYYSAQRIHEERLFTSVREDRKWPLHGMVKCGHCGSGMSIQQTKAQLPLLRCSRKQRSGGEYCQTSTTFPYTIAYHFFMMHVEPVMLAMMTDMKRLKTSETERVKIHQEINKLKSVYDDLDNYYQERVNEGKSVLASIKKLDDLHEEIAILEKQLSQIQGQINSQKSLSGISKVIYELSVKDPLAYNLELNKTGLKIHLKDKQLFFYDPDTGDVIASLRYIKYDRSCKEYVYSFSGVKKYYSAESYIGAVRTEDWTSEKLLHPRRSGPLTSGDIAAVFRNIDIFEKSGISFTLNLDE